MRAGSAELSSRVVFSVLLCAQVWLYTVQVWLYTAQVWLYTAQVWLYTAQVWLYNAEMPKEMPAKIAGNNLKNLLFLVLGL